jgi:pimeloyl-CoA synthetase
MTWYWEAWSKYLKDQVAKEEQRDPSRVETYNKFYNSTTVTQKTFWTEDELIKHVVRYMQTKSVTRTANLLDVMVGQRMDYDPSQLKAFVLKMKEQVKKECPKARWDTTEQGFFLWR